MVIRQTTIFKVLAVVSFLLIASGGQSLFSATAGFVTSAAAVCLAGSLALELLQRRVERLRIGLRGFASMKDALPPAPAARTR